jgi:hypothetical protein
MRSAFPKRASAGSSPVDGSLADRASLVIQRPPEERENVVRFDGSALWMCTEEAQRRRLQSARFAGSNPATSSNWRLSRAGASGLHPEWAGFESQAANCLDHRAQGIVRRSGPTRGTDRVVSARRATGKGKGTRDGRPVRGRTSVRVAQDPAFQAGDAGSIPASCSSDPPKPLADEARAFTPVKRVRFPTGGYASLAQEWSSRLIIGRVMVRLHRLVLQSLRYAFTPISASKAPNRGSCRTASGHGSRLTRAKSLTRSSWARRSAAIASSTWPRPA